MKYQLIKESALRTLREEDEFYFDKMPEKGTVADWALNFQDEFETTDDESYILKQFYRDNTPCSKEEAYKMFMKALRDTEDDSLGGSRDTDGGIVDPMSPFEHEQM